jgi:citrate lyase subunit beta/citryl-CoA lyase
VKLCRSVLFVPGHRGSWVPKGLASGADALILDLEDSVPAGLKAEGRATTAGAIRLARRDSPATALYVRLNSLDSGIAGDDLEAVAIPEVDGFVLPKTCGGRDIAHFDALVTHFERRNGVERGRLEFIVSLETAQAYACCDNLLESSPRVATLFAGTARDADIARSVGFQFTPEGLETLYMRSKALLAMRAADRAFPLVGLWQDIHDLDGCRRFAVDNRRLGFRGQVVIHPSHVPIANEVFSPSEAEVLFYRGMIAAFDTAERAGLAAIDYEGQHVDYAHVKTALSVIALHQEITDRQMQASSDTTGG